MVRLQLRTGRAIRATSRLRSTMNRAEFDQQRARGKAVVTRQGRVLAFISVVLGIAQLALIWWADRALSPETRRPLAGALFVVYMIIVVTLVVRLDRAGRAARIRCPACGQSLGSASERVAAATGRCDSCGGEVISSPETKPQPGN